MQQCMIVQAIIKCLRIVFFWEMLFFDIPLGVSDIYISNLKVTILIYIISTDLCM